MTKHSAIAVAVLFLCLCNKYKILKCYRYSNNNSGNDDNNNNNGAAFTKGKYGHLPQHFLARLDAAAVTPCFLYLWAKIVIIIIVINCDDNLLYAFISILCTSTYNSI